MRVEKSDKIKYVQAYLANSILDKTAALRWVRTKKNESGLTMQASVFEQWLENNPGVQTQSVSEIVKQFIKSELNNQNLERHGVLDITNVSDLNALVVEPLEQTQELLETIGWKNARENLMQSAGLTQATPQELQELTVAVQEIGDDWNIHSIYLNPYDEDSKKALRTMKTEIQEHLRAFGLDPKCIALAGNTQWMLGCGKKQNFTGVSYEISSESKSSETIAVICASAPAVFMHEWFHAFDAHVASQKMLGAYAEDFQGIAEQFNALPESKQEMFLKSSFKYSEIEPVFELLKNQKYSKEESEVQFNLTSYATILKKQTSLTGQELFHELERIQTQTVEQQWSSEKVVKEVKNICDILTAPRYLSFIKAECEFLEIANKSSNRWRDFNQLADKHLDAQGYTESTIETLARSFESFLKTKAQGKECNLLAQSYDSQFYPQGKQKKAFDTYWDNKPEYWFPSSMKPLGNQTVKSEGETFKVRPLSVLLDKLAQEQLLSTETTTQLKKMGLKQ